ncbi:MAG: hypothetical protein EHM93_15540 [Bacteroidales bacterium]|nr:MAG: hypothetical protein EHM93_15540 [Bacteroidales bacterium]
MKKLLLLAALATLALSAIHAQNTCGDQLKVAQRRFDDGLLEDIPQLLTNCMKSGFTDEEKTNAYKLLIQTYLFSDNQSKADEVMLQFLNEFPSYSIANNDPKEFVNLHSTYRTKPIFKVEFKGSFIFCMPTLIEPFGTGDVAKIKPTYKPKLGFAGELNYLNKLYKNFDYSIGVSFTLSNFSYSNSPTEYSTVTGDFKYLYLGFPVAVKYNYRFKGVNLFAKVGFETVYLTKSTVALTRTDNIIGRQEPFTGTEDITQSQNKLDIRPLLAVGVAFNWGRNVLNVSAGFKFSTMNQLNRSKMYSNPGLYPKYFFVEDNLLMNQSYISVSFIRSIYKPKKIR